MNKYLELMYERAALPFIERDYKCPFCMDGKLAAESKAKRFADQSSADRNCYNCAHYPKITKEDIHFVGAQAGSCCTRAGRRVWRKYRDFFNGVWEKP